MADVDFDDFEVAREEGGAGALFHGVIEGEAIGTPVRAEDQDNRLIGVAGQCLLDVELGVGGFVVGMFRGAGGGDGEEKQEGEEFGFHIQMKSVSAMSTATIIMA